jgi:hypothetical protein
LRHVELRQWSLAAREAGDLDEALNATGISLVFAELKDPVRAKVERYELTRTIDPAHFFPTIGAAVAAFREQYGATGSPPPAHSPDAPRLPADADTSSPLGDVGGIQRVRYLWLVATIGVLLRPGTAALTKGSTHGITVQAGQGLRPKPSGEEAHRGGQGTGQQA